MYIHRYSFTFLIEIIMLDLDFIRKNPEIVQAAIVNKKKSVGLNIYDILKLDKEKTALEKQLQNLYQQRNEYAKKRDVEMWSQIKTEISKLEPVVKEMTQELLGLLLKIPNILPNSK